MPNILFSAGCLWCAEEKFCRILGVTQVIVGYSFENEVFDNILPTLVQEGLYRESILVTYNPHLILPKDLIWEFLLMINPQDTFGSFIDRGYKYTAAIYISNQNVFNEYQDCVELYKKHYSFSSPAFLKFITGVSCPLLHLIISFFKKS
ncbi:MAG: peptide-methionine (S)-S-oxide reductase [Brevinema sp.]